MPIYYPGCPTGQAAHICSDCPPKELGDIRSYGYVKSDFTFTDITDNTEWNTGILAGDIYVVTHARGSLTTNPTIVSGFGDTVEELDGYEFEAVVFDPNYADNCNFYNDIKRNKDWKFFYRTETKVHISDTVATIVPKPVIGEDKKASVIWEVSNKFIQTDIPCPSDIPTGIFVECLGVN